MPPSYPVLTPKFSIVIHLELGLALYFRRGQTVLCKSLRFVAQDFTQENIQAVLIKNSDEGL